MRSRALARHPPESDFDGDAFSRVQAEWGHLRGTAKSLVASAEDGRGFLRTNPMQEAVRGWNLAFWFEPQKTRVKMTFTRTRSLFDSSFDQGVAVRPQSVTL